MNTEIEKSLLNDDDVVKTDEGLVFNPYNPLNVKITEVEVKSILTKFGLPPIVHNLELYKRAFVHKSYTKRPHFENVLQNITIVPRPEDCLPLSSKSNERLEYLGDGVLELITKFIFYKRFPKEDEGFMTEKKIAVVKNENIGRIALEMGLHKWLILSKHAEEKKIRTNLKKLGCLFEAFIGALFLDFNKLDVIDNDKYFETLFVSGPGFQMAQVFVEKVFKNHIDWTALIQNDDNYKNLLQVKIQKEFKVTPHYVIIEQDEETGFRMGVYLCLGQDIWNVGHQNSIPFQQFSNFKEIHEYLAQKENKVFVFLGEGRHKIKRKAEQIACNQALQHIHTFTSSS
jgi:dsRNA-specific ribonuclease